MIDTQAMPKAIMQAATEATKAPVQAMAAQKLMQVLDQEAWK